MIRKYLILQQLVSGDKLIDLIKQYPEELIELTTVESPHFIAYTFKLINHSSIVTPQADVPSTNHEV